MSFPHLFSETRSAGRAAFLPYLMAGLPSPEASVELFAVLSESGADGFEIGLPYADPLMDGPVIQEAGTRALAAGMTIEGGLAVAARVADRTGKPCALMTYTNPVLRVGLDEFAARAADSGVSAMIVADLPVDEAAPFVEAAGQQGMGTVLFVAPTTTDSRLRAVVDAGPVFVYGIAEMGVTGERARSSGAAEEMAMRVRAATQIPLVFGVGIASPESAARAAKVADGVIVGSALVRRVLEAPDLRSAGSALAEIGEGLASAMAGGS